MFFVDDKLMNLHLLIHVSEKCFFFFCLVLVKKKENSKSILIFNAYVLEFAFGGVILLASNVTYERNLFFEIT